MQSTNPLSWNEDCNYILSFAATSVLEAGWHILKPADSRPTESPSWAPYGPQPLAEPLGLLVWAHSLQELDGWISQHHSGQQQHVHLSQPSIHARKAPEVLPASLDLQQLSLDLCVVWNSGGVRSRGVCGVGGYVFEPLETEVILVQMQTSNEATSSSWSGWVWTHCRTRLPTRCLRHGGRRRWWWYKVSISKSFTTGYQSTVSNRGTHLWCVSYFLNNVISKVLSCIQLQLDNIIACCMKDPEF